MKPLMKLITTKWSHYIEAHMEAWSHHIATTTTTTKWSHYIEAHMETWSHHIATTTTTTTSFPKHCLCLQSMKRRPSKNDGRFRRQMETADDVIDGFWGTDMVENRKFSHIVAKGYDTQVSKLFKFWNLGVSAKTLQVGCTRANMYWSLVARLLWT